MRQKQNFLRIAKSHSWQFPAWGLHPALQSSELGINSSKWYTGHKAETCCLLKNSDGGLSVSIVFKEAEVQVSNIEKLCSLKAQIHKVENL